MGIRDAGHLQFHRNLQVGRPGSGGGVGWAVPAPPRPPMEACGPRLRLTDSEPHTTRKAGAYLALFGYGCGAVGSLTIVMAELIFGINTGVGPLDFIAHFAGFFPQLIGSLLFGIATLRAGVLPRAAALLLAVGAPLRFLLGPLGASQSVLLIAMLAVCSGWGMLGYALPAYGRERSAQAAPAAA